MPSDPKRRKQTSPNNAQTPTPSQVDGSAVAPANVPQAFQPRLIHPDPAPVDLEGELQLPDDFAALAEQLQDDAAYLTNRYPAPLADEPLGATAGLPSSARSLGATAGSSSSASPTRRFALLTTAAATMAAALSIGLLANRPAHDSQSSVPTQPTVGRAGDLPTAHTVAHQGPTLYDLDRSEPLLLLGDATGPEREGLLDLLQQTASTETGVSF